MKRFLLFALLFSSLCSVAQSYEDEALLFTQQKISGTARSIGSAGAYGSVGADLGSVATNPAGIGLYRSGDFSITPAVLVTGIQSQFNGNTLSTRGSHIFFNQAGFSFTKLFDKAKKENQFTFNSFKLRAFSFAINYQRQNMFNRSHKFSGTNNINSGVDVFAYYINTTGLPLTTDNYPIDVLFLYSSGLITYDSLSGAYISKLSAPVSQEGSSLTTAGATDQLDIAFGGNINDRFYFGAGIGISILTYASSRAYSEDGYGDTATLSRSYNTEAVLKTRGLGVNAKFGFIYRPAQWVRFGMAYHIPTFYSNTENYNASFWATTDSGLVNYGATASPFRYKLRTPMKGTAGISFFYKEFGFISVDYEFLNHGAMRYNFGTDYAPYAEAVNNNIKANNSYGHIIKAGAEGAYKALRVRVGYSYSTTPYKKDFVNKDYSEAKHSVTAGLGYRGNRFYIDAAYVMDLKKEVQYPYADFITYNTLHAHYVYITLGWRMNKSEKNRKPEKKEEMHF